ncbi:tetratricopeptide repeat protein [Arcobacter arenosus]|uniref:tetratricopeptide repeat protein n=1 Tax=Arcobacter arenosus TaxID=2576037 RepID=UPI003BA85EA5
MLDRYSKKYKKEKDYEKSSEFYSKAQDLWKLSAEKGFPPAMKKVYRLYHDVRPEYVSTFEKKLKNKQGIFTIDSYLRELANKGEAPAQYLHGIMGDGYNKSIEFAIKWLRKSAKQGLLEAEYPLAKLLSYNSKNCSEEIKYMSSSAKRGHPEALYYYAYYFYQGKYCNNKLIYKKDKSKLLYYMKKSAEKGNESAKYKLKEGF